MVSGKHYSKESLVNRIKSNLQNDAETGCWEWQGTTTKAGYGMIAADGENFYTHRVMQQEFNKNLTEQEPFVCHTCDNPRCVNPDHLFRGSHRDNMDDAAEKGHMGGKRVEGDDHHQAKLNSKQVKSLRKDYASGEYTQKELADKYGVARTQVGHIVRGEQWQSAEGPILSEKQRKQIESNHRSKENPDKQGENHHNSSLTEEDVIEIREKYHDQGVYQKNLADEYGVARSNIGQIVRGDSWESAGGPTG